MPPFVFGDNRECKTISFQPTLTIRPNKSIDQHVQKMLADGWDLMCGFYDPESRTAYYTFVRRIHQ